LLFALLVLSAWLATVLGADDARRPIDPRERARESLDLALERGSTSPEVLDALLDMRRTVARRPLDSKTRVVYSSLLLALSRRLEDLNAPSFHAALAAELAPVTVPVVNPAAQVLIHAGRAELGIALVRYMFGYDGPAAAKLLWQVKVLLTDAQLREALGENPGAWHAWYRQLWSEDLRDEALLWLEEGHARWPTHPQLLQRMAAKAIRSGDWESLAAMFANAGSLAEERELAVLFAYRARARAMGGRDRDAGEDLAIALRLDGDNSLLQVYAGEAYAALGDIEQARRQWNRARFGLPPDATQPRRRVLVLLARLEDAHGRPTTALRLWREVLELDPAHNEARRRVEDLAGVRLPKPG
jgi:tetratricopeptide (TPR) repeat protein